MNDKKTEMTKKRFWGPLSIFTRYETLDLIKSKRFLLFIITYITYLILFNVVYWALTEKNMEIRHDPFVTHNTLDAIYRKQIVAMFGNTRGVLNYILSIDPVTIIYTYLLLTFSPLFYLLYVFPAISEEVQNKSTKILSLFTRRIVIYFSKFLSVLITTLPVFILGAFFTYYLNLNRLTEINIDVQMGYFLKLQAFALLFLIMIASLHLLASSLGRTTYGALGIGVVLILGFSIISSFFVYVSPFSYRNLVFYPGADVAIYLPLIFTAFSGLFFTAGYTVYKFREFK